jgi:hypothetical protein
VISNPEKLSEIDQLSSLNDVDALAFCGFGGTLSGRSLISGGVFGFVIVISGGSPHSGWSYR